MTAQLVDFTSAALIRRQQKAAQAGNKTEAYVLDMLIEGYEEGLWLVDWKEGEPVFRSNLSPAESDSFLDRLGGASADPLP